LFAVTVFGDRGDEARVGVQAFILFKPSCRNWEFGPVLAAAAGKAPPAVSVPVGFRTFPGEIWATPRSWVETVYPASPTSTRSIGAATSPRGRSRSSSHRKSAQRSSRCG